MDTFRYVVGGGLKPKDPSYVSRQADEEFYEALRAGEFCYVLNSRQMGKSSLKNRIINRLKNDQIICLPIYLSGFGTQDMTPEKWYFAIASDLSKYYQLPAESKWKDCWTKEISTTSPVRCLQKFIEEFLLDETSQSIVIFIDEVDHVLSQEFSLDDFFELIQFFYDQRAEHEKYNKLTFAILGFATPSDLMRDKKRTPFNIGKDIQLNGFQIHEVQSLTMGLNNHLNDSEKVMQAILYWTGGQPFLTQKLCRFIKEENLLIPNGTESQYVRNLVETKIINNWSSQDRPQHFKTISDRVVENSEKPADLLELYQRILVAEEYRAVDSNLERELRLSGLVGKEQEKLRVSNHIYEKIFNQDWIENSKASIRPYHDSFRSWLRLDKNSVYLLNGQLLKSARTWRKGKILNDIDNDEQFIEESTKAERKRRRIVTLISLILLTTLGLAGYVAGIRTAEKKNICTSQEPLKDVTSVNLNKDGDLLAMGNSEGQISVTKIDKKEGCLKPPIYFNIGEHISAITFNNQKKHLSTVAVTSMNGFLSLLEINEQSNADKLTSFKVSKYPLTSIGYSPNGTQLAISDAEGFIHILNITNEEIKKLFKIKASDKYIKKISFSTNGQKVIVDSIDNTMRIWDLKNRSDKPLTKFNDVKAYAIHPKENYLVIGQSRTSPKIQVWDLDNIDPKSGNSKLSLIKEYDQKLVNTEEIKSLEFSPDGLKIALSTMDFRQKIKLWNWQQNKDTKKDEKNSYEFLGWLTNMGLSFSSNSEYLASISSDGDFKISTVKENKENIVRSWQIDTNFPLNTVKVIQNGNWKEKEKGWKIILVNNKGNIKLLK